MKTSGFSPSQLTRATAFRKGGKDGSGQAGVRQGREHGYNAMTFEQLQCMTQVFKGRGTAVVLIGSQGDEYARSGLILR